ncbi:type II secretion system secretin GspD [Porticoccaceae bacterium]|nr:type II secretion system secretin GspD [Porticoccaceae bacterium]
MKDHHLLGHRFWLTIIIMFMGLQIPVLAQQSTADKVTLSLHQADIQDLVRWASSVTKKTIIIHPSVKGSITVVAGEEMSREEAYQVFLSVLQVHGFMVVDTDQALKVIPIDIGKESDIAVGGSSLSPEDMVVQIIKLKNISANDIIALVRPMLPQASHLAAYPGTNTLLIASRSAKVEQIVGIIKRLDQAGTIDIELINVKFASARELTEIMTKLIPMGATQNGQPNQVNLAVDERSNSILMTGDPVTRQQIRALVERLDQPLAGDGNTQVIFLQYARAAELIPILESVSGSVTKAEKDQRLAEADISIRADESLNSLIITAPPSVLSTIKGVIAKLDVRRAQVLVEALIVEVNEDLSRALGVEWRSNNRDGGPESVFSGFSSFPGAVPAFDADKDGNVILGRGLSLGYFKGTDLRSIVRALEGEANANILSTPSILAMDNEEAKILVGENVPFITGAQSRQGDGDPFQTIQRQDIGVVLKIKPHINNSDSVTLEIEQTVESIAQTDAATADIVTNKREISTRALIDNNQILVLGGLIRDEIVESESKIPLLGNIPLIGRAFKSTSSKVVKKNLMVFIHPVILRDTRSSFEATRDRYEYMQENQQRFRRRLDKFFIPGKSPQLEDINNIGVPATERKQD